MATPDGEYAAAIRAYDAAFAAWDLALQRLHQYRVDFGSKSPSVLELQAEVTQAGRTYSRAMNKLTEAQSAFGKRERIPRLMRNGAPTF